MATLKDWLETNKEIIDDSHVAIRVRKKTKENSFETLVESNCMLISDATTLFGNIELSRVEPTEHNGRYMLRMIVMYR